MNIMTLEASPTWYLQNQHGGHANLWNAKKKKKLSKFSIRSSSSVWL